MEIYKCQNCKKRFIKQDSQYNCCVIHSKGECCHAFEIEVTKKGWPKNGKITIGDTTGI